MAITRAVIVNFSCFLLLYSKEGKLQAQDGTHFFRSFKFVTFSQPKRKIQIIQ
jgi:hypothetical protein